MKINARTLGDQPITQEVLNAAIARGQDPGRKSVALRAASVRYLPDLYVFLIELDDGNSVALKAENYPEFTALPASDRELVALGFGGSALCFERSDLHVSIAGLIAASDSLMNMAVTLVAKRNGSSRSDAKATASRENGRKGGRPSRESRRSVDQATESAHDLLT